MRLGAIGLVAATALASVSGSAQAPADPTGGGGASSVEFAASEHARGYQAYLKKDYDSAAVHYENAFFSVPNPAELRNAIRARRDAKQYARAATLAALAHRKFPDDAPTKKAGDEAIAEARRYVQEITIGCALECGVVADGKVVTIERAKEVRFFLDAGHHELVIGWTEERTKTIPFDAKAGASETIKVDTPPTPPPKATATATTTTLPTSTSTATSTPTATSTSTAPAPEAKPLGPAVFYTGVGFTVVAIGATVLSGVDAQNNPGADAVRRNCVGLGESCPDYQKGRSAQLRTNILIGVSGGLGLATAVIGLFLTQWGAPKTPEPSRGSVRVEPIVGLGHVGVTGRW